METRDRADVWREQVIEWVGVCWQEALGGGEPESIWSWRRIGRRVGIRKWRIRPSCELSEPFLRRGVLYLPRVRCNDDRLLRYLVHEVAEATLEWDGCPPYLYVSDQCQRHAIARDFEERVVEAWWES
jgi:hypothetical protein